MIKKIIFLVMPLFLMADYGVVESWMVNIRNNPSLNSKIVGKGRIGDIYKIIKIKKGWAEIGKDRYISSNLLSLYEEIKPFEIKTLIKSGANIRSMPYPSKDNIVKIAPFGTKLKALVLLKNGWYLLEDNNFIFSNSAMRVNKTTLPVSKNDNINNEVLNVIIKGLKKSLQQNIDLVKKQNLTQKQIKKIDKRTKVLLEKYNAIINGLGELFLTKQDAKVIDEKTNQTVAKYKKNTLIKVVKIKDKKAYITDYAYTLYKNLERIENLEKNDETLFQAIKNLEKKQEVLKSTIQSMQTKISNNYTLIQNKANKEEVRQLKELLNKMKQKVDFLEKQLKILIK